MSERYCKGAHLIGGPGAHWLPTAPWDYNWGSVLPIIGCNQLGCGSCGAMVRRLPKASILLPGRFDLRALYEAEDFRTLVFMREDPASLASLYVCRCAYQFVVGWEAAENLAAPGGRVLYWECRGHPQPEFPLELDGFLIVPNMDFPGLLRSVLPSYWPAPLPPLGGDDRGFWVARLYKLLPDRTARRFLGGSIAKILNADEPELWPGVLRFYTLLPRAAGAERLTQLTESQRDRLAAQRDPQDAQLTLADRLFQVLILRAQQDEPRAVAALFGELLGGRSQPGMLAAVARDRVRLRTSAAPIIAAAPHLLDELIYLLRRDSATQLVPLLRALLRVPGVQRAALCAQVAAVIPEPAREAILAVLR